MYGLHKALREDLGIGWLHQYIVVVVVVVVVRVAGVVVVTHCASDDEFHTLRHCFPTEADFLMESPLPPPLLVVR